MVGTLCDTNVLSRPERAQRWTASPFDREELPARAFYATDPGKRDNLDQALFEAAWVEGLDVNEPATIAWAAERAGPDSKRLMAALNESWPAEEVRGALEEFYRLQRPGVPTVIVNGHPSLVRTGSIGWPIFVEPTLPFIKPSRKCPGPVIVRSYQPVT